MKKGNVLVGQSGGPTSVINASLCGIIQTAAESAGFERIYGMRYGIEGFMNEEIFDLGQEDPEVIEGLRRTPGSALGSCRYKLKDSDLPKVKELLEKYGISHFFLIGGNDTMDTIHRVEAYCKKVGYELTGIGVPKTVDNDLFGTDHTPGFASAARYIAASVQQAGRLADDMQRVDRFVVFQTVGREAGWLAASSVLAKKRPEDAPHLIYMPERPLSREKVIQEVRDVIGKIGWCYIVIGEGALWEDGTPVSASTSSDKFSNTEFGAMGGASAAINLHQLITKETGYRGEFQVTESLPMCAIDRTSEVDLDEAYTCGQKAVEFAMQGKSGVMVSIQREATDEYRVHYSDVPLGDVAIKAKPMPDDYINSAGNGVTDEFVRYLRPIVGELSNYSILTKTLKTN